MAVFLVAVVVLSQYRLSHGLHSPEVKVAAPPTIMEI